MDTKALRQKILDLAIRGKLVRQDPNDEPASVLLERIREQKQQMVKEGKLKKKDLKNDSVIFVGEDNLHYEKFANGTVKCIEDEIPFEVPEGWAWARLKHICMMAAGKSKPTEQIKSEPFEDCYPCFGGNGIRGYVDEYNQDGTFSIIGRQGALCGNINIASGKFYATEHAVVTTLFSGIDFNWSNYVLEALKLNEYATGAAQPGLSVANVLNVFVPVPPTREQEGIGIKIVESIKFIETIAAEKEELQRLISTTKSKILDLAIRGKLVPQDPNDEPASVLLERIRAEKEELIKQGKIKRDKKESFIFKGEDNSYYEKIGSEVRCIDEEIPFELPDGWRWARLKTICSKIIDGSHNPPKGAGEKTTYIMASSRNISFDTVTDLENVRYLNDKDFEKENARSQLAINDILLTTVATLGRSCIYDGFPENLCFQRSVTVITTDILPQYLKLFFDAPYFQDFIVSNATGTAQKGFYLNQLEGALVCVPPAKEQKRLSTKIQQILSNIQNIEKSLN